MSIDAPDGARRAIGDVLALLQRGQAAQALELVDHACREHPGSLDLMLHRALALRMLGRLPEALRALDETLAIDPYFFLALMSKGAVLERIGTPRRAALVYRDALKIAPTDGIPAPLEAAMDHAREVVAEDSQSARDASARSGRSVALEPRHRVADSLRRVSRHLRGNQARVRSASGATARAATAGHSVP